jgi:hypothetical protein
MNPFAGSRRPDRKIISCTDSGHAAVPARGLAGRPEKELALLELEAGATADHDHERDQGRGSRNAVAG